MRQAGPASSVLVCRKDVRWSEDGTQAKKVGGRKEEKWRERQEETRGRKDAKGGAK